MTINQLIEKLEELRDYHSAGNCPVFLYNDNGYTYGHINENTMNIGRYTETNGVEFEDGDNEYMTIVTESNFVAIDD